MPVRLHPKQIDCQDFSSIMNCLDVRKEEHVPFWTDVIPKDRRDSMTYFHDRAFPDRARRIRTEREGNAQDAEGNVYGKGMKYPAL